MSTNNTYWIYCDHDVKLYFGETTHDRLTQRLRDHVYKSRDPSQTGHDIPVVRRIREYNYNVRIREISYESSQPRSGSFLRCDQVPTASREGSIRQGTSS